MRPASTSRTALPVRPISDAMPSTVIPPASSDSMRSFQFMPVILQKPVGRCQQPSVPECDETSGMETIGDRVRRIREAQGRSRAWLAEQIGAKGESYVSELELGGIKKGGRLHKIAAALGVPVAYLETGKGEQFSSTQANGSEPPPASQLLRLDPAIVRDANRFLVMQFASVNRDELLFDLDTHAEAFALAYQWAGDTSDKAVLAELKRVINAALTEGAVFDGEVDKPGVKVRRRRRGG